MCPGTSKVLYLYEFIWHSGQPHEVRTVGTLIFQTENTEKVSNSPKFHTASPGSEPRQASFRTHTVSWNKSPSLSYSDPEINQDRVGTHPHLTPVSRESLVSKDLKIHGTSLATQWLRL